MPYAPAIISEDVKKFTHSNYESSYMQVAFDIKKNITKEIRSTIHHDNTARIQSVSRKLNNKFWKLITYFKKITGVSAIMNTSFNRHGIATISSPRQAIEHLLEGCMDYLIISDFVISYKDNRKFKDKKKIIINDNENLLILCQTRFRNIKKYLNVNEKKFYLKNLKKLKSSHKII